MSEKLFLREGPLSWVGKKIAGKRGEIIGKIIEPAPLNYPYIASWRTKDNGSDFVISAKVFAMMGHVFEVVAIPGILSGSKWTSALVYALGRFLNVGSESMIMELQQNTSANLDGA